MKKLALAFALLSTAAIADAVPNPTKITISMDLAQTIFNELSKRPYAEVAPLIARIQAEVSPQMNPAATAPVVGPHSEAPKTEEKK